jgi:hypothetical protein
MLKKKANTKNAQLSDIPCMTSTWRCNVTFTFTNPRVVTYFAIKGITFPTVNAPAFQALSLIFAAKNSKSPRTAVI